MIEEFDPTVHSDGWEPEKMMEFIREHHITCPDCGSEDFTDVREFELMFKTYMGVVKDAKNTVYLRPNGRKGKYHPQQRYTTLKILYYTTLCIHEKNNWQLLTAY